MDTLVISVPVEEAEPAIGQDVIDSTQASQVVQDALANSSSPDTMEVPALVHYRLVATYEERDLRWIVILKGPGFVSNVEVMVDPISGAVLSLTYYPP